MTTSIPSPLGSPSFIEQQWKSPPGKENAIAKTTSNKNLQTPKRKVPAVASSPNGTNAASPSFLKTSEKRIPSIIAMLSPKKAVHSPLRKKACHINSDKSATPAIPQPAAWNTFIPLHYCPQPFELPLGQIRSLTAQVKAVSRLPPLLDQGGMLAKIVELAHTIPHNQLVHYKKQLPLIHPALAQPDSNGLAGSFFAAYLADKVFVMVPNGKILARGSLGKVTEAAGLVFRKNGPKIEFEGHFDAVKHTVALKDSEHGSLDDVLKRVKMRIQAATDLAGVPHVANPYFHGVLLSERGSKIVMMYPRFGGDLFAYHNKHILTDAQRQLNALKVAEHLAAALEGIHSRNYVHRDVKEENLLVDWTQQKLLKAVALADFDLSTNAIGNTLCGTLQYLAPEMMAVAFKDEKIAAALEVDDLSSLYGPALDTWGFGLILHNTLTGKMPEHVYHLIEYLYYTDEIKQAENKAHLDALHQLADEAKGKWIQAMLDGIKKEKGMPPPVETTWKSFIQSLLFIDPRKRPNDAAIRKAIAQLKAPTH